MLRLVVEYAKPVVIERQRRRCVRKPDQDVGGQIDGEWALAAESVRDGLLTLPSLVGNAALDGAGVLLALTLWRRWLLAYMWGM